MRVLVGMETPLRGRSGGHTGTAPTVSFGWIVRGTVSFVWADYAWMSAPDMCVFVCSFVYTRKRRVAMQERIRQ